MIDHLTIRQRYVAFWTERLHKEVPGIALVPQNDPTTLFTGSGMQQFVPNLLGESHPSGTRVFNIQRCIRTQDIEEVGDNRHDTFFEMIGNWSFGDYFKTEQLPWMFDLYTNKEHGFGLDPRKLYVTVFAGDEGIPQDTESIALWQKLFEEQGIPCTVGTPATFTADQRITLYDSKKNWWSRAGTPSQMPVGEIGGPDSELFYDFGPDHIDPHAPDQSYHPNSDSGRFMEIGNSVFVQYVKVADGTLQELPKKNVDFGGGFERVLAAIHNDPDIFKTSVFAPIIASLTPDYAVLTADQRKKLRIVGDHIRASTHLAADGITPGPNEQRYIMRRLIRRAVRAAQELDISPERMEDAVKATQQIFASTYAPISEGHIVSVIMDEVHKYLQTFENGKRIIARFVKTNNTLTGKELFDLYQSTGVPAEDVAEIATSFGATVTTDGLVEARAAHATLSRGASQDKFKGGLADNSEQVVRYHTATHLINQALTDIVSTDVRQEGSNITGDRLRFDFSAPEKPTPDQVILIEKTVNAQIAAHLPVSFVMMQKDKASSIGAKSFFRDKYPDEVKVYFVGESIENAYSKEFCGGPHVANTSEIGSISIYKVEKIGKQIFRIYAR